MLHSMVLVHRIPTLLCRNYFLQTTFEKLLSKLLVRPNLGYGDFKASSIQKLILTPFTISKYKG